MALCAGVHLLPLLQGARLLAGFRMPFTAQRMYVAVTCLLRAVVIHTAAAARSTGGVEAIRTTVDLQASNMHRHGLLAPGCYRR